jgi:probable rRNA maturation factor
VAIEFYTEKVDKPLLKYVALEEVIRNIIQFNSRKCGAVNIIFCTDELILETNRQYLKHDYYTDIITFNYSSKKVISGDLFVSLDTVKSNALLFDCSFEDELIRVVIHGILHLTGLDDKTEEQRSKMRENENYWMKSIIS